MGNMSIALQEINDEYKTYLKGANFEIQKKKKKPHILPNRTKLCKISAYW